jgi:hypothetical protein
MQAVSCRTADDGKVNTTAVSPAQNDEHSMFDTVKIEAFKTHLHVLLTSKSMLPALQKHGRSPAVATRVLAQAIEAGNQRAVCILSECLAGFLWATPEQLTDLMMAATAKLDDYSLAWLSQALAAQQLDGAALTKLLMAAVEAAGPSKPFRPLPLDPRAKQLLTADGCRLLLPVLEEALSAGRHDIVEGLLSLLQHKLSTQGRLVLLKAALQHSPSCASLWQLACSCQAADELQAQQLVQVATSYGRQSAIELLQQCVYSTSTSLFLYPSQVSTVSSSSRCRSSRSLAARKQQCILSTPTSSFQYPSQVGVPTISSSSQSSRSSAARQQHFIHQTSSSLFRYPPQVSTVSTTTSSRRSSRSLAARQQQCILSTSSS